MEITITWTMIIVLSTGYFGGRYLWRCFMKYYMGCPYPFDPRENLDTSMYYRGWLMGKVHGTHTMRSKYLRCCKKLNDLEQAYAVSQEKLSAYEKRSYE